MLRIFDSAEGGRSNGSPEAYCDLPEALRKATYDPFEYLAFLRGGAIIAFTGATRLGDWLHLEGIAAHSLGAFPLPRGLDVRLAEIVAVADAPFGS